MTADVDIAWMLPSKKDSGCAGGSNLDDRTRG